MKFHQGPRYKSKDDRKMFKQQEGVDRCYFRSTIFVSFGRMKKRIVLVTTIKSNVYRFTHEPTHGYSTVSIFTVQNLL